MNLHLIFLFLGGIGLTELLILLVVLAIPGFFVWRASLNNLVKKGPRGINLAAVIMGSVQSPLLILIIGSIIYGIIAHQEANWHAAEYSKVRDSLATRYKGRDTTEIDVIKVSPDKCKVLLENEYVRVLEYTLAPGEKDNPHTHPPKSYYVVEGGTLRIYPENKQSFDAVERKGTAEWGDFVGKHHVENIGTTTVKLLVTEVKAARY